MTSMYLGHICWISQGHRYFNSYCVSAHVTALFIQLRFRPFIEANSKSYVRWAKRKEVLPRHLCKRMETELLRTLMLFGYNRELDYGRFRNSWPMGGLEVVQLLEALRKSCSSTSYEARVRSGLREARSFRWLSFAGRPESEWFHREDWRLQRGFKVLKIFDA